MIPPIRLRALDALRACPDFDIPFQKTQSAVLIERLNAETERWLRMAIEKGPGWNVWRSETRDSEGKSPADGFVIIHNFALIPPGHSAPGAGYVFHQPDLTPGERVRLLAGRHDWREHLWEDDCGVDDCGHASCERARS